jgi:hypothetical protein
LLGERIPDLALAVALVEKHYAGTGLSGGEIASFETGTVGGFEVDDTLGGKRCSK